MSSEFQLFYEDALLCHACDLHRSSKQVVVYRGNPDHPVVMFIGEAPGRDEDEKGIPFCGAAGKVLDEAIAECGLSQDEFYVSNIVKHRPPNNRTPTDSERETCFTEILKNEITLVSPRCLVTLGNTSTQFLLKTKRGITQLKTRVHSYEGFPVFPMLHPAAIKHDPTRIAEWRADIVKLREFLNMQRRRFF